MQTITCPQDSRRQFARQTVQRAIGWTIGLLAFGAADGLSAQPTPTTPPSPVLAPITAHVLPSRVKGQPPMIMPLDVTFEEAGRPQAQGALSVLEGGAPSPDELAAGLAVIPVADGNAALAEAKLKLLSIPSDFSIARPAGALITTPGTSAAAVRGMDLARPIARNAGNGPRKYKVTRAAVEFAMRIKINGNMAGDVPIKIGPGQNLSLELAGLLSLMQGRVAPELFNWLSSTYGVNQFVSFDQLRSAGIAVRYDASHDQLALNSD